MNQWALIENGFVKEITDVDPDGRFHPDFVWVKAPEEVRPGYIYDEANFIAPEVEAVLKTRFSPREYIQRFTMEEQIAIRQAQFSDMEVGLVYDDFNRAEFIDVLDPDVAAGIDLYIAKGLLEPSRREVLLRPGTS
ncbi:hypothetical protein [Achromobacter xylosoxidans]|uniref:hypothetical protein n=1 Tax=Alcaligenes xylosoxydans xylosoxydans TaxID=85698 RepID=UPI0006C1E562|nr:hypothetical protein [Achromobacter xylosoxidans]CUJ51263.1 Uncharacterised protein [Achromobacter xylosoxidans]